MLLCVSEYLYSTLILTPEQMRGLYLGKQTGKIISIELEKSLLPLPISDSQSI